MEVIKFEEQREKVSRMGKYEMKRTKPIKVTLKSQAVTKENS